MRVKNEDKSLNLFLFLQVYILNKSEYLCKNEVLKMKKTIDRLMCDSKLYYKGSLSEFRNHLNHRRRINNENVNFVLIPKADGYEHGE